MQAHRRSHLPPLPPPPPREARLDPTQGQRSRYRPRPSDPIGSRPRNPHLALHMRALIGGCGCARMGYHSSLGRMRVAVLRDVCGGARRGLVLRMETERVVVAAGSGRTKRSKKSAGSRLPGKELRARTGLPCQKPLRAAIDDPCAVLDKSSQVSMQKQVQQQEQQQQS